MKLWEKEIKINQLIENFTIGNDPKFDLQIAKFDVQGTLAHIKMLQKTGLLTEDELKVLEPALHKITEQIEEGKFCIEAVSYTHLTLPTTPYV